MTQIHILIREADQAPRELCADYSVSEECSVVGITPHSEACRSWIDQHVHYEGWQWLGGTLWVDHRCAPVLLLALDDYGFAGEGC